MSRNHRNRKRGLIQKKRAERDKWRADEREWLGNYFTLDDVVECLQSHPAGCVFELNAPQNIVDRLSVRPRGEWFDNLKEFRNCFIQSEIYCPHEGIDRRTEYSMEVE